MVLFASRESRVSLATHTSKKRRLKKPNRKPTCQRGEGENEQRAGTEPGGRRGATSGV